MADRITRDTLLGNLDISIRLHNCLINEKKHYWGRDDPATVGDFMGMADHELMRIPNFGRKSLAEWKKIVWAVDNPDAPPLDEVSAEYKALREMRAIINQIAASHRALATHYNKLSDIISPLG
jgi:hypothetical protein